MDTTISDDAFIEAVVSAAHREVIELSEEHIFFNGPDPQILIHIWHENGCYFGGTSERNYRPGGAIRANDLTTVKQWLVMELFDFLRLSGLVWFCGPGVLRVVGCYWWCCAHWRAYWLGESQSSALWGCSSL